MSTQGQFAYSHHPLNRSFGLPFDYNGTLNVLTLPGQRGVLIFWCAKSLLFSLNSGEPAPAGQPPPLRR